jgi:hypothetical protein
MSDVGAMNGLPPAAAVSVNAVAIELVERHLAALKRGETNTVAIISVDHQGQTVTNWAGPRLGDVYIGCATIHRKLMDGFIAPPLQSRILRPR